MKKNGFTTLLKVTTAVASIAGVAAAYVFKDEILNSSLVSSIKEKISGSEEDIFDEDDCFEESTDVTPEDVASREYVSLDIEAAQAAASEVAEAADEEMTLEQMEDAIEEEIQQESEQDQVAKEESIEEESEDTDDTEDAEETDELQEDGDSDYDGVLDNDCDSDEH